MARLSLMLVIAAALVATATASDYAYDDYGHDDYDHGDYGKGGYGKGDYDYGEWGEIDGLFKNSRRELRDLVRACFLFLVRNGVSPKLAIVWAIRSCEFLFELWDKVLHKHHDFHVDVTTIGNVRNQAQQSVSWVGPHLKETEKYYPGILKCIFHLVGDVLHSVTGSLSGGHGYPGILGGIVGGGGSSHGGSIGGGNGGSIGGGSLGNTPVGGIGSNLGNNGLGGGIPSGLGSSIPGGLGGSIPGGLGSSIPGGLGGSIPSSLSGGIPGSHGGSVDGLTIIGKITSGYGDGGYGKGLHGTKLGAAILS